MSDRLSNTYPSFANNFPQGLPSQQPQHRPPQPPQQQLSSLGTQPTLTGIRKPEEARVWQQQQQQQQQQMQMQRQQQQQQQQQQQHQLQQQQQHSGGESIPVTTPQQQQQAQIVQYLRNQVTQGLMTREQAQERFAMLRTTAHAFQEQNAPQQIPSGFTAGGMAGSSAQHMAALSQRPQAPAGNPMSALQRVMQAQDSLHARQLNMNMLVAQGQQSQNGFASRVGQNIHPSGMGLPQGQGSLQQNFIQPSPSAPPANIQSSTAPSASQPTSLGGPQNNGLHKNFAEMPVPQLTGLYGQLMRAVEEGEKNLSAAGSTGEGDIQRQALRARLDGQKQLLIHIRELINLKRQGGDPAQQTVNGAQWLGAAQRGGLYPAQERPPQHTSPLNASVNPVPPQRSIPTPQQNFPTQSNLTQMSPHVSGNGLPFNGALTQMSGAPPQPPPQAPHPPPQQTIPCSRLPTLPEDRFKLLFTQFANNTGLRLNDRDFVIDGRPVSPWALHRAVFARNGFDSVTANDEWPVLGAALGFPTYSAGDLTQPPRCAPTIAHRLQQLYNECLRHFEQAYINNVLARLRNSQALMSAQHSQQQAQSHQPTDADYQALLAIIPQDTSAMTPEAMSILPRFSHTSGAELEAHRVPPHIVQFVEQHRDHLQRTAQDQNGFRAGLTSTKNLPIDNRVQINQAPTFQGRGPAQLIPTHPQLNMSRQALTQAQGKPNALPPTQLNNGVGLLARPPTAQSMGASSMSSMGTQITGAGSNGAQSQSGSAPLTQVGIGGVSSSSLAQSAGAVPLRRPTAEEVMSAKRWVEEQKRSAFNHSFDGVGSSPVPESEIQEYTRNLERLDMVLGNMEKYIHVAFAALRKEDVVRRMFIMMASTKFQLEETKKPNPRYVLELHTIRGMIQEADNMDKGLRTVLGFKLSTQGNAPSPQQPQQPPSMGPTPSFAQPAPPAAHPAAPSTTAGGPRPPPPSSFQAGHRKKQSQTQAPGVSTPAPSPIPTASTPTPQASMPGITAPSPQAPKSPKGKAAAKSKPPTRRKATKTNSVEPALSAPAVASTLTSSTPVDTKGGVKRTREDEIDGATPGAASAPSPKRVKSDWEGLPNEEARKRDEQAENVKTDEQAMAFFETVTKFIDENPESAEAASNALDEILRTYPPVPDVDDAAMASSFPFGDLPPTSPHHDDFGEFFDLSAFDDTPTPDLVAGSSTNPSPESTSDQDHPHTGHAGSSPQIPNVKSEDTTYELLRPNVLKEISGGDAMFHQTPGWRWEGHMDTPDQPWGLISTS